MGKIDREFSCLALAYLLRRCSSIVPQFNLVTEDLDVLKEDLKFWRTQAINPSGEEPPVMKIDIFLDVSELSQNQILVVVDETLRRNRIDLASSATSSGSRTAVDKILLESWTLTLK
jgi:Autophagy-related protein 13